MKRLRTKKRSEKRCLKKFDVDEASLASNTKFSEVLISLGVNPPRKIGQTTGKETFAFAKNDALFQALLNSSNEDVALICEARLKVKSTLERTRAQRFADISERGTLPVPLNYYGAHTGRWSAARARGLICPKPQAGVFLTQSYTSAERLHARCMRSLAD
jgi:hypothetical protein